jgi:hypothetical protein
VPVVGGLLLERKIFFTGMIIRLVRGHPQAYFPFHYRFGVLEPPCLEQDGAGYHPAADAWGFLDEKDESGRFRAD